VVEAAVSTSALRAERVHLRHAGADYDSVRDVTLSVERGEVLALVGPNGSGKSTLLSGLARDLRPRTGRMTIGGEDAWRLSRRAFARQVARLPQDPACPEGLQVEALVATGRYSHRGALLPLLPEDRRAVREAMAALELSDLRLRGVETLSGGERRRAWLAMVLAQGSEILLLDEPTASLDVRQQWEVLILLGRLNRERGTTLVVSIHDLEQAAALAHRVAILHRGRLYDVGAPERCINPDMLRDVFGVDADVTKEDGFLRIRVRGPADPLRSL
jgi:iron complex transport system ATP-binding protein